MATESSCPPPTSNAAWDRWFENWASSFRFVRIVGDIHGLAEAAEETCADALGMDGGVLLLGDLVNRGPDSIGAARLAVRGAEEGWLRIVPGNHDHRLLIWTRRPGEIDETRWRDVTAMKDAMDEISRGGDARVYSDFADVVAAAPAWIRAGKTTVVHAAMPHPIPPPAPETSAIVRNASDAATVALWGVGIGAMAQAAFAIAYADSHSGALASSQVSSSSKSLM
jgi:protein phosphatase